MILRDVLKQIVKSQESEILSAEKGVKRKSLGEIDLDLPHAQIVSGVRRCGKSTFMRQLMDLQENPCYFNFEDPRALNFEVSDFKKLEEIFNEEYGICNSFFFDEIQNVARWEVAVRSILDREKKVVVTGSNASLLSRELGTRLTGRHLRHELFPFSYTEMLTLTKKKPGIESFDKYMEKGGFPEYLRYGRIDILQSLFEDIIARDIVVRHNIRNSETLREMAVYLLTNTSKEFTYNSLRKIFSLGSTNTATSFVSYLGDSYLVFTVPKFDYSLKKRLVNPKKVYSIDVGLANANSVSFSEDKGRVLENIVYLKLREKTKEIFYYRRKGECDFVAREGKKITRAVQVCYSLNEENQEREINGLIEALNEFNLKEGLILTHNQEDQLVIGSRKIIVKPAWKWMT
ncbi:MAG: ATP-binding protein [Patescibacteria group bacterium]|nr:ATP-binding protein [Patescibacteria group bacterium]